jgi:hypothetical protein
MQGGLSGDGSNGHPHVWGCVARMVTYYRRLLATRQGHDTALTAVLQHLPTA